MAILGEPVTHNSNIGEGRRSSSRSSSHDSDSSPRTRAALLAPDSGDEAETPAVSNAAGGGSEPEAPIVRPPVVPVWGGARSAFSGFLQINPSSPFLQQPFASFSRPESDVGRDGSSESTPGPGYPTSEAVPDNRTTGTPRTDDARKTSIPSLLISSAASMLPVPPSLHDFSSPQASGSGSSFPLTPDSATSTVTAGPSNPPSTAGTDRHSPPSPPPSQPANSHQTTTTHSGAPGRGRGAKRGTKPGAKRGEWRVKNYTGGNTSATGEQMQPADPSTYSSFFKVAPPTTPVPEPEPPSFVQNGNGNYQIASSSNVASSSNLRLQVPSEVSPGMQVSSRSTSSREHSSDGDDFGNGVTDFNQYDPPTSPQPPDNMDTDSTGPPKRLVALVIEDKRYGDSDLQLVEVTIPVLTSSDGSVWVEAENVCAMLQKGPSRIDGPAKVFTYRGKLRQYFLRVSNDNHDTYGPANLTINHRRVLKVFVEADVPPPRTVVMDHAESNNATNLYRSPVQHPSGYLASPATPGTSEYGRSPIDYNHSSRNVLKRNYDYSASSSSSTNFHAAPSPPITSSTISSSASKKARRQQSGSNV